MITDREGGQTSARSPGGLVQFVGIMLRHRAVAPGHRSGRTIGRVPQGGRRGPGPDPAVGGGRTQPGRAAAVRRVDGIGQSTPRRALSFRIVSICTTCREKAKAFIPKPENAKPGEVSPAAKLARAAVTKCVLCGVLIVPAEAAEAQAGFPAGYSVMHHASQVTRVPAMVLGLRDGKHAPRKKCGTVRPGGSNPFDLSRHSCPNAVPRHAVLTARRYPWVQLMAAKNSIAATTTHIITMRTARRPRGTRIPGSVSLSGVVIGVTPPAGVRGSGSPGRWRSGCGEEAARPRRRRPIRWWRRPRW